MKKKGVVPSTSISSAPGIRESIVYYVDFGYVCMYSMTWIHAGRTTLLKFCTAWSGESDGGETKS